MTFPFPITVEIADAFTAHQSYTSAGTAWLQRNDPEGTNEVELLETIKTKLRAAALQHYGDDEDAYDEFCEELDTDMLGNWFDALCETFDQ